MTVLQSSTPLQFNFGKNWSRFTRRSLTKEKVLQSRADFNRLMAGIPLRGKTFLDIGFGQGLSLLAAREAGAHVFGIDINPSCREALQDASRFYSKPANDIPLVEGSILDTPTLESIAALHPPGGTFDIVHSWGVLHHTGAMRPAIHNAISLVAPGGHFICALYNRHWSSPYWRIIKKTYCTSPEPIRRCMVVLLFPLVLFSKFAVTRRNPFLQDRGMDFYYNLVDWVGGYPYEWASHYEVRHMVEPRGFRLVRWSPAPVPTGCNEFVFLQQGSARDG